MRVLSGLLSQFEAAGFTADEKDRALKTLMAYLIGIATSEAAYLSQIARSGKTEEWVADLRPAFDEASQEHPRLRQGNSARQDTHPQQIRDDDFAYGLARVLDGLASRLDA
ncbi:TetR/AcrR family transcriptional regulator C-terminal domain-containing protein [Streptomyces phaeochromogenes]|uniref:TetR/AcrR family transcriptional regulator C-terminal domain-containing protein n=1 Tax=Streptomyces phaeochromogenes TaxID=1923 RepID=UPI0036BB4A30